MLTKADIYERVGIILKRPKESIMVGEMGQLLGQAADEIERLQKYEEIVKAMAELAWADPEKRVAVGLADDWGKWSLTLLVNGGHTHIGLPAGDGGDWEHTVEQLRNSLCGGPGLSFASPGIECERTGG